MKSKIAIIGGGNLGMSMAKGLTDSGQVSKSDIIITRQRSHLPKDKIQDGFHFQSDNADAVSKSEIIIISVLPMVMNDILEEIKGAITEKHTVISVVTNITTDQIQEKLGKKVGVVRAMPNTAIRIRESMTCIAFNEEAEPKTDKIVELFNLVGTTLVIGENYITSATALGSCGIAFFLRVIRAAAQGGTQIGFHAEEAQLIAAQTAKGAAELILKLGTHPEDEIDKVTTPRGVTIAGLNEMEHNGLSSAFIKGIVKSYEKSIR